jgi:hypothetical protein
MTHAKKVIRAKVGLLEVAKQLRQRKPLSMGCTQVFKALRRLLGFGIEAPDIEPREGHLNAVDDGSLLARSERRLASSPCLAVLPLSAQPAEKGAFQARGVEPVGFGAVVLP